MFGISCNVILGSQKGTDQLVGKIKFLIYRIGFFNDQITPDGDSLAMIALIQQLGSISRKIPARPFMTEAVDEIKDSLMKVKTLSEYKRFIKISKKIIEDIIEMWSFPPNSPATVKKKGFDDPLKETGFMKNNVEIREGEQ